MKLNSNQIETINSLGPYNHSVWSKGNLVITQEEVLSGRADFIVLKIRQAILNNYSIAQIRKMSIVDVGCYDGYILQQLSDLPFKKMVGIEPRQKNINKGKGIRKILNIKEKIQFKRSTIEDLGEEKYDIVLCIGVLHHVESISVAIKKLNSICNKMIILESLCLSSVHITEKFKIDIEMKDLIYKTETLCGITGQKFESSYYDGSAASTSVISIPSIETIKMILNSLNHTKFVVMATPDDFSKAMKKNTRPSKEVLIYSINKSSKTNIEDTIYNFESGILKNYLKDELVNYLYDKHIKLLPNKSRTKYKILDNYISYESNILPKLGFEENENHMDIIKNFRYNRNDKIIFEFAKFKYRNNKFSDSITELLYLVQKINTDWRVCYRAFYLLSKIYTKISEPILSAKYSKLCKTCNPEYPLI
jgi:ubiquinone/menaquinone biosynthesis C-methylase UbiE